MVVHALDLRLLVGGCGVHLLNVVGVNTLVRENVARHCVEIDCAVQYVIASAVVSEKIRSESWAEKFCSEWCAITRDGMDESG